MKLQRHNLGFPIVIRTSGPAPGTSSYPSVPLLLTGQVSPQICICPEGGTPTDMDPSVPLLLTGQVFPQIWIRPEGGTPTDHTGPN
jgi:hypothetical protein